MSTSDGRPLTRRQLRELRQTGQNPVIPATEEDAAVTAPAPGADAPPAEEAPSPEEASDSPAEAASAEAAATSDPAEASSATTPEEAAADADHSSPPVTSSSSPAATAEPSSSEPTPDAATPPSAEAVAPAAAAAESAPLTRRQRRDSERRRPGSKRPAAPPVRETAPRVPQPEPADVDAPTVAAEIVPGDAPATTAPDRVEQLTEVVPDEPAATPDAASPEQPIVRPGFGQNVARETPVAPDVSFDELLTRPDTAGSTTAPSALVLSEIPGGSPLSSPITGAGDLIVTSSHRLPEGFGERGAAQGTTDGREADAVLIDGEIPLASSPTPIAASQAISTSKSPGEVIRPPAPEKNHRLVLTLGITAGGLGIAVIAAVVVAYATGVFN